MSGDGKEKVSDTSKFSRNLNVPDIFIDKNLFIFFSIHLFFFFRMRRNCPNSRTCSRGIILGNARKIRRDVNVGSFAIFRICYEVPQLAVLKNPYEL